MSDQDFNINNPSANQILIYSEIEQKFINVEPTLSIFGTNAIIEDGLSIGNGERIFNDIQGNTMRFKSITGSNGINIINNGASVDIHFDGDAQTLGSLSKDDFLQISQNLSDVNPSSARTNLDVYSIAQSHTAFLEANASNVPDDDNTYDLGSNGRRFANMFAETFHGTATEAIMSQTLEQGLANDGDVLTWSNADNDWVAETPATNRLNSLEDVDSSNIQNESVLYYNGSRNLWEVVPVSVLNISGGTGNGDVTNAENIGGGIGTFSGKIGGLLQFRSLLGGSNVNISTSSNDEEVVINVDVPQTTDDLIEGGNNLYYTNARVESYLQNISIQDLGLMNGTPVSGQAPVWDGSQWIFGNIVVDINTTDDLPEGNNNLYYVQNRVFNDITTYIDSPSYGITVQQLADVNFTSGNGNFLVLDNGEWINRQPIIDDISDINTIGISDDQYLVYNAGSSTWIPEDKPVTLEDLQETTNAYYLNQSNFDSFFNDKTTDDLSETSSNKYLNPTNLSTELGNVSINDISDVDISSVSDGNVLVWDAAQNTLRPASSTDLNVSVSLSTGELNDVDSNSVDNIQNGYILKYNASQNYFEAVDDVDTILKQNDVNANSISSNQGIVYDGSEFINQDIVPFNSSTYSDSEVLAYDGVNGYFRSVSLDTIDRSKIGDLDNVTINSISNGDVLVYNTTNSAFENIAKDNIFAMSDITNVTLNTLSNNQIIAYDGSNFVNRDIILFESASDEDIIIYDSNSGEYVTRNIYESLNINYTTPVDGSTFVYDGNNSEFVITQNSISNLIDVDITSIVSDQFLQWNGSEFTPVTLSDVIDSLGYINDVDLTGIATDQFLQWNGSQFVPVLLSDEITSIDYIPDVDITGIASGEILEWNGSQFTNTVKPPVINEVNDIGDVSAGSITSGQILEFDGTNYVPIDTPPVINELGDISNVNLSNLDPGDAIRWSGTEFIAGSINIINQIVDLIDVNVTDQSNNIILNNNDLLIWDGTEEEFIPYNLSNQSVSVFGDVDISGITSGQILEWDGSQFVAVNNSGGGTVNNITDLPEVDSSLSPTDGQILEWDDVNGYFIATDNTGAGAGQLSELSDVNSSLSPSDGQSLVYDSGLGYWVAQTVGTGGSGATQLSELSDVDGSLAPNDGEVLQYSSADGYYISVVPDYSINSIDEVDDVDISGISTDQFLQWNGTQFVPTNITEGATQINELNDVDTTGIASGSILEYDGTNFVVVDNLTTILSLEDVNANTIVTDQFLQWNGTQFVAATINEGASQVSELSDVDLTGLSTGQVLEYDGANFVPANNETGANQLDELTDVEITSISNDQILVYDGTNFVNQTVALDTLDWFNITSPSDGDLLVYNSTNSAFEQQSVTIVESFNDLSDVAISSPSSGQFVRYDGTNFVNETVTIVSSVNDLTDVNNTNVSSGQILEWNGSEYVPVDNVTGATQINDLSDVDTTGLSTDQFLQWNGTNFVPATVNEGATQINELSDVDISSITLDQVLQWDGTQFIPTDITQGVDQIGNLNDVNISGITTDQFLQWDGSQFVPATVNEGASQLNDLSDVSVSSLASGEILEYNGTNFVNVSYDFSKLDLLAPSGASDGQVLVYNSSNGQFEPEDQTSGGANSLTDLTDVTISSPVDNQFIRYDGTNFVNETVSLVTNINDLGDVDTSGVSDGQVLAYNNSTGNFEVTTIDTSSPSLATTDLTDVSTTVPNDGQVMIYNSTSGEYEPQDLPSGGGGSGDVAFEVFQVVYDGNAYISAVNNPTGGLHIEITDPEGPYARIGTLTYTYPPNGVSFYAFIGSLAEYDANGNGEFTGGRYLYRPLDQALGTGYVHNRDETTTYTKESPFGAYNTPSTNDANVPRFYQDYTLNMTDLGASHVDAFTGDAQKFADVWFVMTFKT